MIPRQPSAKSLRRPKPKHLQTQLRQIHHTANLMLALSPTQPFSERAPFESHFPSRGFRIRITCPFFHPDRLFFVEPADFVKPVYRIEDRVVQA